MATGTIDRPNSMKITSYYVSNPGTTINHTTIQGQILVIATRVIEGATYGSGMWFGWDNQNSSTSVQSWLMPICESPNSKLTVTLTPGVLSITPSSSYTQIRIIQIP